MQSFSRGFLTALFWLSLVAAAAAEPTVMDAEQATIVSGSFDPITWFPSEGDTSPGYGDDQMYSWSSPARLDYDFDVAALGGAGTYRIWVTWDPGEGLYYGGYAAKATLVAGTATASFTYAGHTAAPEADATIGGRPFQLLYEGPIDSATIKVKLEDHDGYSGLYDAVAVERVGSSGGGGGGTPPPANVSLFNFDDGATPAASGDAYGGDAVVISSTSGLFEWHIDSTPSSPTGLPSGKYRLYISMPHGPSVADAKMKLLLHYPMAIAPGSQTAKSVEATYPIRATAGTEWGGANWELFADEINVSDLIQYITVQVRPEVFGEEVVIDGIALERVGDATTGDTTPELWFAGATSPNMLDETGGGGPGGGDPGGADPDPWDPEENDPWATDVPDGRTDGEEYPGVFGPLDHGEQQLGPHVSVYYDPAGSGKYWGTAADVQRPSELFAWTHGETIDDHTNRSYSVRAITLGGRLKLEDSGAYVDVKWYIAVGRNGFIQVNFGPASFGAEVIADKLPRGETYLIAAIDNVLSDGEKLPVFAHAGAGEVYLRDASDLHGERWEAVTRNVLRAIRSSLPEHKSWTGAIPRSPDQSFDPNGGAGSGGSPLGGWPTDDAVPEESMEEDDEDGDGVPDYRDSAPSDSSITAVKEHPQTQDKNFFSRWSPEFDSLKERLKNPFGDAEAPTLEQRYPEVYLPVQQPNGSAAYLLRFSLMPDESPLGASIEAARIAIRLVCTFFVVFGVLHKYVKMFQSW